MSQPKLRWVELEVLDGVGAEITDRHWYLMSTNGRIVKTVEAIEEAKQAGKIFALVERRPLKGKGEKYKYLVQDGVRGASGCARGLIEAKDLCMRRIHQRTIERLSTLTLTVRCSDCGKEFVGSAESIHSKSSGESDGESFFNGLFGRAEVDSFKDASYDLYCQGLRLKVGVGVVCEGCSRKRVASGKESRHVAGTSEQA